MVEERTAIGVQTATEQEIPTTDAPSNAPMGAATRIGGMPLYRRLLVALDGSARAEAALPDAVSFARRFGTEVVLASVFPAGGSGWLRDATYFVSAEAARRYLDEHADALRTQGLAASALVLRGAAAEQLAAYAAGNDVDLIAMATRGDWGRDLGWHGSVTDALVRAAPVPVLLRLAPATGAPARPPASAFAGRLRIVVPLDGSRLAERALPPAAALAAAVGGGLLLVQAIEEPLAFITPWSMARECSERELRAAHEYLAAARQQYARPGLPMEATVRLGPPAAVIGWVARDAGSDLIVMTSHGRSGARRERLGSVALAVLRSGPGLMLLVPSGVGAAHSGEAANTSRVAPA